MLTNTRLFIVAIGITLLQATALQAEDAAPSTAQDALPACDDQALDDEEGGSKDKAKAKAKTKDKDAKKAKKAKKKAPNPEDEDLPEEGEGNEEF
jgi:hypothetical protein